MTKSTATVQAWIIDNAQGLPGTERVNANRVAKGKSPIVVTISGDAFSATLDKNGAYVKGTPMGESFRKEITEAMRAEATAAGFKPFDPKTGLLRVVSHKTGRKDSPRLDATATAALLDA